MRHSRFQFEESGLESPEGSAEGEVQLNGRLFACATNAPCRGGRTEGRLLEMSGIELFLKLAEEGIDGGRSRLLEKSHPAMHVRSLRLNVLLQHSPFPFQGLEGPVVIAPGFVCVLQLSLEVNSQAQANHDKQHRGYQAEDDDGLFVMGVHGMETMGNMLETLKMGLSMGKEVMPSMKKTIICRTYTTMENGNMKCGMEMEKKNILMDLNILDLI